MNQHVIVDWDFSVHLGLTLPSWRRHFFLEDDLDIPNERMALMKLCSAWIFVIATIPSIDSKMSINGADTG